MSEIFNIESVSQLKNFLGSSEIQHPLVTIIDFSKIEDFTEKLAEKFTTELYAIVLKGQYYGTLKYGRGTYDFQEGTLVFMAPKQVISADDEEIEKDVKPAPHIVMNWGIFFHPDLLRGTILSKKIKEYSFFSYESNEALHLSNKEKQMLTDIVLKIEFELSENIDSHSQNLIVSNIELLLNYCVRYYDRQFITRKISNKGILSRFENLLSAYFQSEDIQTNGLPSVRYCAENLNLSPNYLGDLLKKETGKNAQEHIHFYLIEEAKNRLMLSTKTVSEIAFELGFNYPQYFSKMFKNKTGLTPVEYRNLN
jgi:AraC-like DNA-binding protein